MNGLELYTANVQHCKNPRTKNDEYPVAVQLVQKVKSDTTEKEPLEGRLGIVNDWLGILPRILVLGILIISSHVGPLLSDIFVFIFLFTPTTISKKLLLGTILFFRTELDFYQLRMFYFCF